MDLSTATTQSSIDELCTRKGVERTNAGRSQLCSINKKYSKYNRDTAEGICILIIRP